MKKFFRTYIYMTGVNLGEGGSVNILGNNSKPGKLTVPIGEQIYPIYQTRAVKTNGVWVAVETKLGHVPLLGMRRAVATLMQLRSPRLIPIRL